MTTKQLMPWMYKPMERAAAIHLGETTYFTGRPCKYGHITRRLTLSGTCLECQKKIQKKSVDKRLANNPSYFRDFYKKHAEKYRAKSAKYREKNPEKIKETNRVSSIKFRDKKTALQMKRHATKLQAVPKWLTKDQLKKISEIYKVAKETTQAAGFPCHVDHIIPLQGKYVCGLHVPWNLRIVSQSYNSKKSNNLDEFSAYAPVNNIGVSIHSSALPWNWSNKNDRV